MSSEEIQIRKQNLIKELKSWFNWVEKTNKNKEKLFWKQNIVAAELKAGLSRLGHWRRAKNKDLKPVYVQKALKITIDN
jgi:hypothetical protein